MGGAVETKRLAAVGEHDDDRGIPDSPFRCYGRYIHIVDTAPADVREVAGGEGVVVGVVEGFVDDLGDLAVLRAGYRAVGLYVSSLVLRMANGP